MISVNKKSVKLLLLL